MTTTTTSYKELLSFYKCPILWNAVYIQNKQYSKPLKVLDFLYKSYSDEEINTGNNLEKYIKAEALKTKINAFHIDQIIPNLVLDITEPIELPDAKIINHNGKKYLFVLSIHSSESNFYIPDIDLISDLQMMALKNKNIDVEGKFYLFLQNPMIKMKKAETEEEFEKRRQALLEKSKTGKTKAVRSVGETKEEFMNHCCESIKSLTMISSQKEPSLIIKTAILHILEKFKLRYDEYLAMNLNSCTLCEYKINNRCPILN